MRSGNDGLDKITEIDTMIPNSVEDIVKQHTTQEKKYRALKASAAAAGLAVAVSMFVLKHEINKVYFDLSNRIDSVQQAPAYVQPENADAEVEGLHVHIHNHGYSVSEPCVTRQNGVYEVRPC